MKPITIQIDGVTVTGAYETEQDGNSLIIMNDLALRFTTEVEQEIKKQNPNNNIERVEVCGDIYWVVN